jgi:hypothetical protein
VSTDGEIYTFLNWMIRHEKKYDEEPRFKNKQVSPHILAWDEGNFVIDDTVLNNKYKYFSLYNEYLFSEKPMLDIAAKPEDKAFLLKQYTAIQDSVWHKKFSKSTLLKREEQKRANRYYLSIPLFSRSKKYALVQKIYYCGQECGYGGYFIYERTGKNKWKQIAAVKTWIS